MRYLDEHVLAIIVCFEQGMEVKDAAAICRAALRLGYGSLRGRQEYIIIAFAGGIVTSW